MAEIENGSFEIAGATPGEAQLWTFTPASTTGTIAAFSGADGTKVRVEQFDHGWGTSAYLVDPEDGLPGTIAIFDAATLTPTITEQFDNWNNEKPYAFDVNTGITAEFTSDTSGQVVLLEQFDEGWDTAEWTTDPATGATFTDTFDTGWSTDAWANDVTSGTVAMFDGGSNAIESFEDAWPDILFFVDPGTDLCTAPTMPSFGPPPNGFPVTIVTTGGYPDGLVENRTYFLKSVTTVGGGFTFNLALTVGGTVASINDAGQGSHYLHADPAQFWTRFEE